MSLAPPPLQSLSLSDIMHPMSPPRLPNSPVVEILHDHEIARMRAKALQMGLGVEESAESTPRERELFDMVLRLTNPNLPSLDPSQLVHQAETISGLVHQRDYLTRQIEEERSRWECEKEGWERMAEALIIQRNRKVNGPDDSELQRMCHSLEFENRVVKEKLNHTQGRINALEAELSKLKPHLLMQPFVPRPTILPSQPPAAPASTASHIPPPTEMETNMTENAPLPALTQPDPINAEPQTTDVIEIESSVPEQSPPVVLQPPTLHALAQASSYFSSLPFPSLQNVATSLDRKKNLVTHLKKALRTGTSATSSATQSDAPVSGFPMPPPGARTVLNASSQPQPQLPPRKFGRKKSRRSPPQLMVSDARAEHLLIAARRIGRERAGIVAGVISAERERMEREKAEREKERLERETERVEREKRNRSGGGYYRERPDRAAVRDTPTKDESRTDSGSGSRYASAMAGYVNAAGSPTKVAKGKGKSVPTPLDSLLNAARSMMDGGPDENENDAVEPPPSASTSSAGTGMMTRRRAANANEPTQTEASPPKRRRLSSNASQSPTRVRTALDVLADQAAVFSNSGKGKGKGQAEELATSIVPLVKRKRGRPPNKDRNKPVPEPALSNASRLISPAPAPAPAPVAGPSHQGTRSASISASEISPRPATKWVQRGRLASTASSIAPPRQKDDLESEDEEDELIAETDKLAEPEPEGEALDPVVRPTGEVTPRLPVDDEVPPAGQDNSVTGGATQPSRSSPPPAMLDDPVDADADGESDPDIDMEAPTPSVL
ncbi:hypothetical protein DFH09DRAFT_1138676 [Mycena vulgaris]|nr:hypothetical protein DFH09DRAFT_1138676 [Mycena vulgaris]